MSSIVAAVVGGGAISAAGVGVTGALVGGYMGMKGAEAASDATRAAADTGAQASMYATDVQQKQYEQTRKDNEPWRKAGTKALTTLEKNLPTWNKPYSGKAPTAYDWKPLPAFTSKEFIKDPGYDYRLKEGYNALEGSAAARGGLDSGAELKALTRFGQDFASNEWDKAYGRFVTDNQVDNQAGQNSYNNDFQAYTTARNYYNDDNENAYRRYSSLAGVGAATNAANSAAGQNMANNVGNIAMQNGANQANAQIAQGNIQGGVYQGWGNAIGNAMNAFSQYGGSQTNNASVYQPGAGAPGISANDYWY